MLASGVPAASRMRAVALCPLVVGLEQVPQHRFLSTVVIVAFEMEHRIQFRGDRGGYFGEVKEVVFGELKKLKELKELKELKTIPSRRVIIFMLFRSQEVKLKPRHSSLTPLTPLTSLTSQRAKRAITPFSSKKFTSAIQTPGSSHASARRSCRRARIPCSWRRYR